jgi:hypothetical protein
MNLFRRVLRFELRLRHSLYRWIFRRPERLPAGSQMFGYTGVITPLFLTFITVSAIEIPAAHYLLPWRPVRILLLIAGTQGLLWMIGLLASLKVRPHVLHDDGLRIRYGSSIDVTIPWDEVAKVRTRMRAQESSKTISHDEDALHIAVGSQTNIDILLHEPKRVELPKGLSEPFTELRFYADSAAELAEQARGRLKVTTR